MPSVCLPCGFLLLLICLISTLWLTIVWSTCILSSSWFLLLNSCSQLTFCPACYSLLQVRLPSLRRVGLVIWKGSLCMYWWWKKRHAWYDSLRLTVTGVLCDVNGIDVFNHARTVRGHTHAVGSVSILICFCITNTKETQKNTRQQNGRVYWGYMQWITLTYLVLPVDS